MKKTIICGVIIINMATIGQIESGGDPNAYNKKSGAKGKYQITEICRKEYNKYHNNKVSKKEVWYEKVNYKIAKWYLNKRIPVMLKHYGKKVNIKNILWCYNAGIQKVLNGEMPKETKNYIKQYKKEVD